MKKTGKRSKSRRSKKNATALIAAALLLTSALIFPLSSEKIIGVNIEEPSNVLINYIERLFTQSVTFDSLSSKISLIMSIAFILSFLLYLLNGLGLIYNKYSRYASLLTIVYFFLGLYLIVLINREFSLPFFGNILTSIGIGPGIYFAPIVGLGYLFLVRKINSVIRF